MRLSLMLLLTLLFPLQDVARADVPRQPAPDKGTVAVSWLEKQIFGPAAAPTSVYLARLPDDGDPLKVNKVLPSNYSRKKQAFLLNCDPGRYVVVAAKFVSTQPGGKTHSVFLDREGILASEVVVEPGQIAFMGRIIVEPSRKLKDADEAQSQFLRLIEPEASRRGFTLRTLMGSNLHLGTVIELDQSAEAEVDFLTFTRRKAFKRYPAWRELVEARLSRLQGGAS